MKHVGGRVFGSGLVVLTMNGLARPADWPNYHGPNHDAISLEKGFKTTWSEPPKVLWEHPVGSAFSSFACVGERAYTCGAKDKQQVVFCFDADTGKVIWQTPFEKELKDRQGGDGTRATPTVHQGRVYQVGGHGLMVCLDAETGKEIWKKQLSRKPKWGYAGSVLIEGDLAIVPAGGKDGAILALDKKTGQAVWKCADDTPGYSTPYPFTFQDRRYVFCFAAEAGLIADAKTGREVCRIPWKTDYDVNASSPVYHDGHLFLSTGYDTGCALFKLTAAGDALSAHEVWRSKVLLTKFTSCVLIGGMLYGGDQTGLHCVEFISGKELWKDNGLNNASVLVADDHLLVLSEEGELLIAKPTPKEFKPIAKARVLSGRCWTIVTLYNGKLYARNLEKAVCLDLSNPSAAAQ